MRMPPPSPRQGGAGGALNLRDSAAGRMGQGGEEEEEGAPSNCNRERSRTEPHPRLPRFCGRRGGRGGRQSGQEGWTPREGKELLCFPRKW